MTTPRPTVLHIEDDSLWQTAILSALRALPQIAHAQHASTARDGLVAATALRPDIVLLDLSLPDGDGLILARELARLPHGPRILFLSSRRDVAALHAAGEPHVSGLIWKIGGVFEQLPEALAVVAQGGRYYSPEAREAMRRFRSDPKAFFKLLTPRELDLMPHVACGASDAEIATALGLSEHTVKTHRLSAMWKLDLPSAPRLTHWAIVNGFGLKSTAAPTPTPARPGMPTLCHDG